VVQVIEGTAPLQASAFRKGTNIIMKDAPCKVVDMSTSKTGKHGGAKINFTGLDIFTGRKYQQICGSTQPMLTFESQKSEWAIMSIEADGAVSLINDAGETREDMRLPPDEELSSKIKNAFEAGDKDVIVQILTALKRDQIVDFTTKDQQ